MSSEGIIFDLKGFALNDGPGVRTTVFLKGCPLRCRWCHNPEGLSPEPELYVKLARCTHCGKCAKMCSHPECQPFHRCLHVCPMGNLSVAGKRWEAEALVRELQKDRDLYENGGGVTFSGGEPLLQHEFVRKCARLLRESVIHTALETSSFAAPAVYRETAAAVDLILADLKLMDGELHRTYCGVPNEGILNNLRWLMESGKPVIFRIPLIPGVTDTDENLTAISAFIGDFPVELLTYNVMAGAKYASVGREFAMPPAEKQNAEKRAHIAGLFRNAVVRA